MDFIIVRNNKAPVKSVFEYLPANELKNPNGTQKQLLKEICDGVEFHKSENFNSLKTELKKGDDLYYVNYKGDLELQSRCLK